MMPDSDHAALLAELTELEPIFHTAAFGTTMAQFEQRMAADYWEIGASGRRYTRAGIVEHLKTAPLVLAEPSGWRCTEHALLEVGADTFLITYLLHQGQRISRRCTVWSRRDRIWQILYHQGTLVTD